MKSNIRTNLSSDAGDATDLIALPHGPIPKFQTEHNAPLKRFSSVALPTSVVETIENYDPVAAARSITQLTQQRAQEKAMKLAEFQHRLKARVKERIADSKSSAEQHSLLLEAKARTLCEALATDLTRATVGDESFALPLSPVTVKRLNITSVIKGEGFDKPVDGPSPKQEVEARIVQTTTDSHSARRNLLAHAFGDGGLHTATTEATTDIELGAGTLTSPGRVETDGNRPLSRRSRLQQSSATLGSPDRITSTSLTSKDNALLLSAVRDATMKASRLAARVSHSETLRKKQAAELKRLEAKAQKAAEEQRKREEEAAERQRIATAATQANQKAKATAMAKAASPSHQRSVEAKRFLEALRKQTMARVRESGIELPRLCNCSPHLPLLAPHWEHCANNCMYYRNPKAYTQALSDLFQSLSLT